jgi:sugar lactone lactonase YvrE
MVALFAAPVFGCGAATTAETTPTPDVAAAPRAVVTTFAGKSGVGGSADGSGPAARFGGISGLAFDTEGLLWVSTAPNIRTVTSDALVSTVAGKAGALGYRDGKGPQARFQLAFAVAPGPQGDAFVIDQPNNLIRKVTADGLVTTFAGKLRSLAPAEGVGIGITSDPAGNLYTVGGDVVRKFTPDGAVTVLAGKPGAQGFADGRGPEARFDQATGITRDDAGNLYVADGGNAVIRKVTPDGAVTTVAGKPGVHEWRDGDRETARLERPDAIAIDSAGNLFVGDYTNTVRMVRPDGSVISVAGKPYSRGNADGTGSRARFDDIIAIACDDQGQVFVAVNAAIRKLVLK